MKLIYCLKCDDCFKPPAGPATDCRCGSSSGRWLADGLTMEVDGPCLALGIENTSLVHAVRHQLTRGDPPDFDVVRQRVRGRRVEAFVIPDSAPTVRRLHPEMPRHEIEAKRLSDEQKQKG